VPTRPISSWRRVSRRDSSRRAVCVWGARERRVAKQSDSASLGQDGWGCAHSCRQPSCPGRTH
jgi:hypothetical protein